MNGAVAGVLSQQTQRFLEEFRKLSGCLFAARVHEFAMLDSAFAGHVAANFYVVSRIDEYELGDLPREQHLERLSPAGITAEEPMITKNPQIAGPCDDFACGKAWQHVVSGGTGVWRHP